MLLKQEIEVLDEGCAFQCDTLFGPEVLIVDDVQSLVSCPDVVDMYPLCSGYIDNDFSRIRSVVPVVFRDGFPKFQNVLVVMTFFLT